MLVIGLTAGYAAAQGGLTPPGAPTPTMKTLQQVESRTPISSVPYSITQSGSYYLTANLTAGAGENGITVSADDVTIDLNGFTLRGSGAVDTTGIFIANNKNRMTVKNGIIRYFDKGIYCTPVSMFLPSYSRFEKLSISSCSSYGIYAGKATRINDCNVHNNAGSGIVSSADSLLSNCMSRNNFGSGISVGNDSVVEECIATGIQGDYGISAGDGALLENCTANNNQVGYGIYVGEGSSLNRCIARNNSGYSGIYAEEGASLRDCTAYGNTVNSGIYAEEGAIIRGCNASRNSGTNTVSYGMYAGAGSLVAECVAKHNNNSNSDTNSAAALKGQGIVVGDATTIKNCSVIANKGCGMQSTSYSYIYENIAFCDTRWSVLVNGDCNRVERNHLINPNSLSMSFIGTNNIEILNTRTSMSGYPDNFFSGIYRLGDSLDSSLKDFKLEF